MRESHFNKRFFAIIAVVAVLFLIVAILLPYIHSVQRQKEATVANAVDVIFSAYKLDERTIERAKYYIEKVIGNDKHETAFEEQAIAEIKKINGGLGDLSLAVYDVVIQQKLLEAVDFENDAIKRAYDEQIIVMLDLQDGLMTFDDFVEGILEEPLGKRGETVYRDQPAYYTSPQKVFAETYLPQRLRQMNADVLHTKDTEKILKLCADLAVLSAYDELVCFVGKDRFALDLNK